MKSSVTFEFNHDEQEDMKYFIHAKDFCFANDQARQIIRSRIKHHVVSAEEESFLENLYESLYVCDFE